MVFRVAGRISAAAQKERDHVGTVLRHALSDRVDRELAAPALRALRVRARAWLRPWPVRMARPRIRPQPRIWLRRIWTRAWPPRAALAVRGARHHARTGEGDRPGRRQRA